MFPTVTIPFLDNIRVKGLYTDYNNNIVFPRIYRSVFKHILNLNKTLKRYKRAGACIRPKLQFLYNSIIIIGYVYSIEGQSPTTLKVKKIVN